MNKMQEQVTEFNQKFGVHRETILGFPPDEVLRMRLRLIDEENGELNGACLAHHDIVETIDALGDLLYVVFGMCDAMKIDIQPFFDEIHRSNMSKLWSREEVDAVYTDADKTIEPVLDGSCRFIVKRADGKIIKSPSYSPANIKGLLEKLCGESK